MSVRVTISKKLIPEENEAVDKFVLCSNFIQFNKLNAVITLNL